MGDLNVSALKNAMSASENYRKENVKRNDDSENSIFSELKTNFEDGFYSDEKMSNLVEEMKGELYSSIISNHLEKVAKDETDEENALNKVDEEFAEETEKVKDGVLANIIHNFLDKIASGNDSKIKSDEFDKKFTEINNKMKEEYKNGLEDANYESIRNHLREQLERTREQFERVE